MSNAFKKTNASFSADKESKQIDDSKRTTKTLVAGPNFLVPAQIMARVTRRVVAPYAQIEWKGFKKEKAVKYLDLDRFKFFLNDEVNLNDVLYESAIVMKNLTSSSGVFLYVVNLPKNEIVLLTKNIDNVKRHEVNIPICTGKVVAAHVAETKEYVVLDDVERDTRFSEGLRFVDARTALCVPVMSPDGECYAVVELYRLYDEPYSNTSLHWVVTVCGWAGTAVHQTKCRITLQRMKHLDVELQKLIQLYFSDRVGLDTVLTDLLAVIKTFIGALRSSFYIIDKEHVGDHIMADMWDDGWAGVNEPRADPSAASTTTMTRKKLKVNLSSEQSPAAHVVRTGKTLKLNDAYSDIRFTTEIDPTTGAVVRTVLASPLTDKHGVIGVVQLINKVGSPTFTPEDEEVFEVFISYCCLVVHFANMQRAMHYNEKLNEVSRELMSIHLAPCCHDLTDLLDSHEVIVPPPTFFSFEFHLSETCRGYMARLLSYMFADTIGEQNYVLKNMADFILTILSCYRENPYHNAEHAFHFTHTMYMIMRNNKGSFDFAEVQEWFLMFCCHIKQQSALMLAGFCHDVDHPGYNNNFMVLSKHPLATMYHSSQLENHHFYMAKKIIEDKNLLSRFSPVEHSQIISEMRHNIISTDLAVYFQVRGQLAPLLAEQAFNWEDRHHRSLVKSILMTSCDLSGCCKPFPISKSICESLYEEFYHQGDCERQMGYTPLSMMDRRRSEDQPAEQVQFISVVVLPCLLMLQNVFSDTKILMESCRNVQEAWAEELEIRGEKVWRQEESIPRASTVSRQTLVFDK